MLADQISVNDGVAARTYKLISRVGMDSVRRETTAGVLSKSNSGFVVKHTIDAKSTSKPNRHLVSFSFTEYDANAASMSVQAHAVITRHKGASDAEVLKQVEMLANFLGEPANVSTLLIGGN